MTLEAMHHGHSMTLDARRRGDSVVVVEVLGEDAISRRLKALGFWPGTVVKVEHVAPFGDPVAYRLHGYRLALRRREAERVRVTGSKP
jgi:Fe2+ transport system protein FeoA